MKLVAGKSDSYPIKKEGEPPGARPSSSAVTIVRDVVKGLYEGRYVPGQRLAEIDLMRTYGLSRGSVREALHRLAAEGVVTLSLHRGAQIRALSLADTIQTLEVLELLIGLAGRSAALRIGEGDNRARVKEAMDRLAGFEGRSNSFDFIRARDRFYRTLIETGANHELARILPGIQVHLVRLQLRANDAEALRFRDYRAIYEAVSAGDPNSAERTCRRHVRNVAKALQSTLAPASELRRGAGNAPIRISSKQTAPDR